MAIISNIQVQSGSVSGVSRSIVGGRIDLSSATQLTWATAKSQEIDLYNGTAWERVQPSSAPTLGHTDNDLDSTPLAVNSVYDLYAEHVSSSAFNVKAKKFSSSGAGSSSRGYTPYEFEGVLIQENSDAGKKRRYIGTIYTSSNGGTVNFKDDAEYRFIWNYYNQVEKHLIKEPATSEHTYLTGSMRDWGADASKTKLEFVVGMTNRVIPAFGVGYIRTTSAACDGLIQLGLNGSNVGSQARLRELVNDLYVHRVVEYNASSPVGYNYLTLMQYGFATSVTYRGAYISARIMC